MSRASIAQLRAALIFACSFLVSFGLSHCQRAAPPSLKLVTPTPTPTPTPVVLTGWLKTQNERWTQAQILPQKVHFVQAIAAQITRNRSRYEAVASKTKVPWEVVGAIHNMEAGLDFRCNLGQGDPLTAQSRHVPKGRPPIPPQPPFTWEYAAVDALEFDLMHEMDWESSIAQNLQNVEAYNGLGYQQFHPLVPSPYLWSWTTVARQGKYVADGKWSPTATSDQCGVVPILKSLP